MIRAACVAVAAAGLLLVAAPLARGEDDVRDRASREMVERLVVVERTDAAVARAADRRRAHLQARTRAMYKLERAGLARMWADAGERDRAAWRRLLGRRLILREARELELLAHERAEMVRARAVVLESIGQVATAVIPEPGSMAPPAEGEVVARFGATRDADTGTRISRRGVGLEVEPGDPVSAIAPGEVAYAGPIRNLGDAVVVEHEGGVRSILGGLADIAVGPGDAIEEGATLGLAADDILYLEVRIAVGPEGLPIDPEPLLD